MNRKPCRTRGVTKYLQVFVSIMGVYTPLNRPEWTNTTQCYFIISDWKPQLVLWCKARELSDSWLHVKGENVCENVTGQNYLERIPNYAEMHHNSSCFCRRDTEILWRICDKIAPSPVEYFCASNECILSNWVMFTKQHTLGSMRNIITSVFVL